MTQRVLLCDGTMLHPASLGSRGKLSGNEPEDTKTTAVLPVKKKQRAWLVACGVLDRKKTWITCRSCWTQSRLTKRNLGVFVFFVSILMSSADLPAALAQVLLLDSFEESTLLAFPA